MARPHGRRGRTHPLQQGDVLPAVGGKAELIVKAMRHNKPAGVRGVDTGSLRGHFLAALSIEDDSAMERNSAMMRGLIMEVHHDPDFGRAFRELLIEPERAAFNRELQRAVDRGEIRADNPASDHVPHVLIGGYFTRTLIDDRPPTRAFLAEYADAVLFPALGVRLSPSSSPQQ